MICPKCNTENRDISKFCKNCRNRLKIRDFSILRKISKLGLAISILFAIVWGVLQLMQFPKYYKSIEGNCDDYNIKGKDPIFLGKDKGVKCFYIQRDIKRRIINVTYLENGQTSCPKYSKWAQIHIQYFDKSNEKEITYFDKNIFDYATTWRNIHKIIVKLSKKGTPVSIAFYDNDNNAIADESKVAKYQYELDDIGYKAKEIYFNVLGERMVKENGIFEKLFKCDNRGNVIEEGYYGKDGKLKSGITETESVEGLFNFWHTLEYAFTRCKYDKKGRVVENSYYDVYGKLIECKESIEYGPAISRYKYDKKGNIVEKSIFGKDAKLKILVCTKYDKDGNNIEESYYGENNKLKENNNGIAILRSKYNDNANKVEESYCGDDGKLKECSDGYRKGIAIVKSKYDNNGNEIESCYFDKYDKLKEDKDGIAIYRYKHDEDGNNIERSYFNQNERLKEDKDGIAIYRYKYNNKKQCIEYRNYGYNGKLKRDKKRIAVYTCEYDSKGNQVNWKNYDENEKPI